MPRDYEYIKLNEIENSNLKEFNVYGIIKDVFYKATYDRKGATQDEYRLKLNDGTTGDEDINITAFVNSGEISPDVFEREKIVRFHRLTKNYLKNNGGFYLGGRIGAVSSVLTFNIPPPGARFKFNPAFRSHVSYSHSDIDDEILADLFSRSDEILDKVPAASASSPPQQSTPPLRRSPRKTPQKSSTQVPPKTQPPSAIRTPTRQQRRKALSQHVSSSTRRSSRLRAKSLEEDDEIQIDESSDEEVTIIEKPVTKDPSKQENTQQRQQQRQQPEISPPQRQQRQQQLDGSPVSRRQQQPPRPSEASPQANEREIFTEISHLVCGNSNYYNVFCQIVSCYRNLRGHVFLRVWDGTRNPRPTKFFTFNKYDLIYGDLKKERRIAADKKLYEVACYSEHGVEAANLKAGDYIALINIHFFLPKAAFEPSLVMHDGEGTIKTDEGFIMPAGRKVIKINAEEHQSAFSHIDELIKAHEPNLPVLEEEENESDARGTPVSNETWNNFLGIEPRLSPQKKTTVAPTQTIPSQSSTITLSSDGSTQRTILVSQISPNRNVEVVTTGLAGSSKNHFYPKPRFSQISPSSNPTPFQRIITGPDVTVPARNQPSTGIFARRPQPIPFDTASQSASQSQQPTVPKRSRLHQQLNQSPQKSQNSSQSVFDSLRPENNFDDCFSQSQHDELKRIEGISDTEMQDMWADAENPDFQSSQL